MPIKVTVDYIDDSGTPESELRGNLAKLFGDTTHINISPTSTNPETCISFGISKLITEFQMREYFDEPEPVYQRRILDKRKEVLELLTSILDTIIIDNESKWEE